MVIQVDFALAVTVLAQNLRRLLASRLPVGFQCHTAFALFRGLLCTWNDPTLEPSRRIIALQQKHNLPEPLATIDKLPSGPSPGSTTGTLSAAGPLAA